MKTYASLLLPAALILGFTLSMLASTIYVASVPEMAHSLETSASAVQLTFAAFFLALAIGGLVLGPACDRYGRKSVLLPGLALCVFGSLVCSASPSIEILIIGRVLQGLGASAASVVGRAIIRDVYPGDAAARMLAAAGFGITLVQGFAPALGGQLQLWFGWRANFIAVTVLSICALLLALRAVPRDARERPAERRVANPLSGFSSLLTTPQFLGYAFMATGTRAAFHIFAAGGPVVLISHFGITPEYYGLYVLLPPAGFLVGSFITATWKISGGRLITSGIWVLLIAGTAMVCAVSMLPPNPFAILVPMALICCASGLITPNVTAASLQVDPLLAGSASALVSCLQLIGGAAGTMVLAALGDSEPVSLAIVIATTGALGTLALLTLTGYPQWRPIAAQIAR